MEKQIIRLNEEQLNKVIKESLYNILSEGKLVNNKPYFTRSRWNDSDEFTNPEYPFGTGHIVKHSYDKGDYCFPGGKYIGKEDPAADLCSFESYPSDELKKHRDRWEARSDDNRNELNRLTDRYLNKLVMSRIGLTPQEMSNLPQLVRKKLRNYVFYKIGDVGDTEPNFREMLSKFLD